MLTITFRNREYPLATTLRVAYKVQGQHNHKPYTEVFQSIGDMTLEDQIAILFAAFQCGSPNDLDVQRIKQQEFLDFYLDNYTLQDVMNQLKEVIEGIVGKPMNAEDAGTPEDFQGN